MLIFLINDFDIVFSYLYDFHIMCRFSIAMRCYIRINN